MPVPMNTEPQVQLEGSQRTMIEGWQEALMTAMRQLGVGSQGGAQALAIFHQHIYDEWASGSCAIALLKWMKNCFGMIECGTQFVRQRVTFFPSTPLRRCGNTEPCHTLSKRDSRCPRIVVQSKEMSMAPLECSLALGRVAAGTRVRVAAQQAACTLPWIGVDDPLEEQRLQAEHASKTQNVQHFQLGGQQNSPELDDKRHAPQGNGGLADQWHVDDGDILCHPILVPSFLQEPNDANDQKLE